MVKNHAHCTFELKYLLDYQLLQNFNDSTLLLVMSDGKDRKMNSNDVKPCRTSKLVKNARDSFGGDPSKVCI